MKLKAITGTLLAALLLSTGLAAQQQPTSSTANPLDRMYQQVKEVLNAANLPFSAEQDRSVVLMMEDRRAASEELFGQTMDFRGGPVQGQQLERAMAASCAESASSGLSRRSR